MAAIELERKKADAILPNQYNSIEELYDDIEQAETELRNGGGYTTAEAKAKIEISSI